MTTAPDNINTLCTVTLTLDKVYDRGIVTINDCDEVRFWYKNKAIIEPYMLREGENKAVIKVLENGVWSREKEITFTAEPAPTLAQPVITMDSNLQIGDAAEITIVCDENTERLRVMLYSDGESTFSETYETGQDKTITIQLTDEVLSAGPNCLFVDATAEGYNSSSVEIEFTVAGERPDAPAVSFSKTAGEAGETVYATIVTEGITEMHYWMWGDNYLYYSPTNGKCVIPITMDFYGSMDYTFRTQIDGVWSQWSGSYTLETGAGPGLDVPEGGYVVWPGDPERGRRSYYVQGG